MQTTSLVQSITDEQIAEIERFLDLSGSHLTTNSEAWRGIISRLRAAEMDAARYRAIRDSAYVSGLGWSFACRINPLGKYDYNLAGHAKLAALDAAIDAAMKGDQQ